MSIEDHRTNVETLKTKNEGSLSKDSSNEIRELSKTKKIKISDDAQPDIKETNVNSTSYDNPIDHRDIYSQEIQVEIEDPLQFLYQNSEINLMEETSDFHASHGDEPDSEEECYVNGNGEGLSQNVSHKNYCPYCSKSQVKLSRHLVTTHQSESKVQEVLKLPKLTLPRKKLLEKLRIFGNYLHNKTVLLSGKGELVHSVRPKLKLGINDYIICEICLGLFLKNQKDKHSKVCSDNSDIDWSTYYDMDYNTTESMEQENFDLDNKPKGESCRVEEPETIVETDNAHFILDLPVNDHEDFQIHSGTHFLSSFLSPELRSLRPINDELGLNLASMTNGDGRKNYCPYCSKPSVKLNRHILSKHSEQLKVQELLKYSKFSDERKRIYEELRLQGNLQYNIAALTTGRKETFTTADFNNDLSKICTTICPNCNLFTKTVSLNDHSCRCKEKNELAKNVKEACTSSYTSTIFSKSQQEGTRNSFSCKSLRKTVADGKESGSYPNKKQKIQHTISGEVDESFSSTNKNKLCGKKNYCLYCGQLCAKVVRHFASKHKDESEVLELLALDPRSEERLSMASDLRQRGNLVHNLESIKPEKTKFLSRRKPKTVNEAGKETPSKKRTSKREKEERKDYVPCPHCQGLIKKNLLYKHIQKCTSNNVQDKSLKELLHCGLSLLPVSPEVKKLFKVEVLDTMIKDDLAMIIHDDKLIRDYGEHMFAPGRKKSTLLSLKRKLRLLAKFLEQIMERDNDVECLRQILHPAYFREVLACAKKMYKYCPKTETFENAFSSYYVAQGLKFCAEFHQQDLIANSKCDSSIKEFIKLFDTQFYNKVSRKQSKMEASCEFVPSDHPYIEVAEDVFQIYEYMDSESLILRTKLKLDPTPEEFLTHMKATLSSLAIVNSSLKRDIETLTVDDYKQLAEPSKSKCSEVLPDDIMHRELYKISKQDNKGKNITIYLTKDHKHALDLSLELREAIGVNEDNQYLFPRVYHSSLFCLKASICLKDYTKLADLKNADLFVSSEMEKHISRLFTVLHVSEHVLKDLQNFLNIHGKIQCSSFDVKNSNLMAYFVQTLETLEDPSIQGNESSEKSAVKCDQVDVEKVRLLDEVGKYGLNEKDDKQKLFDEPDNTGLKAKTSCDMLNDLKEEICMGNVNQKLFNEAGKASSNSEICSDT